VRRHDDLPEPRFFGLTVVDKDEGMSSAATTDAELALVKAGNCYAVYLGVEEGDPLSPPYSQATSHVTYCGCPE
jgi:hypothetical protein